MYRVYNVIMKSQATEIDLEGVPIVKVNDLDRSARQRVDCTGKIVLALTVRSRAMFTPIGMDNP